MPSRTFQVREHDGAEVPGWLLTTSRVAILHGCAVVTRTLGRLPKACWRDGRCFYLNDAFYWAGTKYALYSSMTPLEHLHLAETLGEGGMGVVYSAEHEILHKTVAVKMMREGSGTEAAARFMREAELASRIQSAHVVRVLYTALYGHTPYMVLERVEGRTLGSDIQAHGPWSPPLVSTLVWQLVRGLDDIHAVQVVHADLKPENVMLDTDANGQLRARIIDFGVARSLRARDPVFESDSSPSGTPCAMSPEQISAPATPLKDWDIWALAGLAFTALTGKCAYDGESVANVLLAIVLGNAPLVSDVIAVSPLVDSVFCKAFSRDVADRFATPAAFAAALDAALREPASHPHRVVVLPKPKPLRHLGLAHADTVAPLVRARSQHQTVFRAA